MSGGPYPAQWAAAEIGRRLRGVGVDVDDGEFAVERRGDRVMAALPGGRIAWFAATADAAAGLRVEDRVLALVGARCSFPIPAVLAGGPGQLDAPLDRARCRRNRIRRGRNLALVAHFPGRTEVLRGRRELRAFEECCGLDELGRPL